MKWILSIALSLICAAALAAGPDDQYVQIYNLIQEAERLEKTGQSGPATAKYAEAQTALQKLHALYPSWNDKVVRFRLNFLAGKLASLPPLEVAAPQVAQPAPEPRDDAREAQRARITALEDSVRQLEAERANLEAKLREALSVQPAAVDPEQLRKAEERVAVLEKERDLLRASVEQQEIQFAELKSEMERVPKTRRADAEAIQNLEQERDELRKELASAGNERAALELRWQTELRSFEAELKRLQQIEQDRALLQQKLNQSEAEVAALKSRPPIEAAPATAESTRRIDQLEKERADLSAKLEAANRQILSLEAQAAAAPSAIKQAERERDDLAKKLGDARFELAELTRADRSARSASELSQEITRLRDRLAILEARAVPYSSEELALMKQGQAPLAAIDRIAGKKSFEALGVESFVQEAERAFAAGRLEEAEQKYLHVLKVDDKNSYTLANLAAIQIELDRTSEAEKNLRKSLAITPDDAFSLTLLGILRLRQDKYDEALDALSRAAQLDPNSAETQNYLGITLSQKGQRGPAETALRKAIQLRPDYAGAHHNLAVIYATQKPPSMELARWHYQKALGMGHPKNPELETSLAARQ